jgi:polyisoprenoid-binding protein YceI
MVSKIKKLSLAVIISIATAFSVQAQDATMWMLDKSHTSINFSINHFFSAVTGKFTAFDGNIHLDPNNVAGSKADFTISINSVNTDDDKRDDHLQSADFFDATTYPTMRFASTRIEKKSDKEFMVHGKLTIKDITKDVVLPLRITGEMEHPMMKGTIILGVEIDTTISRSDFGVGTGSWAATMVVGDEVRIHIPMELNRMK